MVLQLLTFWKKIQVSMPQTAPLEPPPTPDANEPNVLLLPPPSPSIQLTPLLGNAPTDHLRTLHALYASQIATVIWTIEAEGLIDVNRRSVIVGLALKKSEAESEGDPTNAERETFHGVMGMVKELIKSN